MLRQFVFYCFVGGINTLLGLAVILALMDLGHLNYLAANAIGYASGFVSSFVLNRRFTFPYPHETPRWRVQAAYFSVTSAAAYLAQLALVVLLVRKYEVDARTSQVVGLIMYVAVSFIGNRCVTFAPPRPASPGGEPTNSSGRRKL